MSVHIESQEIINLSHLAKLQLAPAEELSLAKDLAQILSYVAKLQSVAVAGVSLSPTVRLLSALRPDEAQPSTIPLSELLPEMRLVDDLLQTPNVFASHESADTDHN